jgi:membrane fusion protein (multidrug efflux system)
MHCTLENLTIVLADGSTYPLKGKLTQVDRSISEGTGTLTLKAEFDNPDKVLLPGMFAHLQANVGTKKDALLVPQRAVTEIMYKTFVYIVNSENKVEMKEVKLGARVGRLWVVESGLDGTENIIVEGTQKVKKGSAVKAEAMTEQDLYTYNKIQEVINNGHFFYDRPSLQCGNSYHLVGTLAGLICR